MSGIKGRSGIGVCSSTFRWWRRIGNPFSCSGGLPVAGGALIDEAFFALLIAVREGFLCWIPLDGPAGADCEVTEVQGEQTTVLELRVASEDLGKVIGKQGRTARAMRTLLAAAGTKNQMRAVLEILDRRRMLGMLINGVDENQGRYGYAS